MSKMHKQLFPVIFYEALYAKPMNRYLDANESFETAGSEPARPTL